MRTKISPTLKIEFTVLIIIPLNQVYTKLEGEALFLFCNKAAASVPRAHETAAVFLGGYFCSAQKPIFLLVFLSIRLSKARSELARKKSSLVNTSLSKRSSRCRIPALAHVRSKRLRTKRALLKDFEERTSSESESKYSFAASEKPSVYSTRPLTIVIIMAYSSSRL